MASDKKFHHNRLFKALMIKNIDDLKKFSRDNQISQTALEYCNNNMIFPEGEVLEGILRAMGYSEIELKVRLGILDSRIIEWISENPEILLQNYNAPLFNEPHTFIPEYRTELGDLYHADCISLMKSLPANSVDLIFADPPFNLNKQYESGIDDYLSEQEYIKWNEEWLLECVRILAPGGSMFVYNLPYWNTHTANVLNRHLNFRHWISVYLRGLMPIRSKLLPAHYGLLYYVKGEQPKTFNTQRLPMMTCRHCGGEYHDYGGKKKDCNPMGQAIADVWIDIHPVRHKGHKNRDANELPIKLMERIISLASNEGETVFDPFGGSGTTYAAAEILNRKWIGVEIGDITTIVERLQNNEFDIKKIEKCQRESNVLFTEEQTALRRENNFWLLEDFIDDIED